MNSEQYNKDLIEKFEEMYASGDYGFFDVPEYVELIEYYLDIFNVPLAKKALELSSDQYPANEEIMVLKIEYFIIVKDIDSAKEYTKKIIKLEIESVDLFINIGKIYSIESKSDLAIKYYMKAVSLSEADAFVYQLIGEEYYNLQDPKKALYYFIKSYKLDQVNIEAFLFVIYTMKELGMRREAVEFCMSHTDKHPYFLEAWYEAGQLYETLGDLNRANRCFSLAHAIMPDSVPVLTSYGNSLLKQLKFQKAVGVFEDLIEHAETTSDGFIGLATAYLQLDNYDQAESYFKKATEVYKEEDKVWFSLYKFYSLVDNNLKANYALKEAIKLNDKKKEYWIAYLEILPIDDKISQLETIEEIVSIDPLDTKYINEKIELMIELELYIMVIENISAFELVLDSSPQFDYYLTVIYTLNEDLENAVILLTNAIKQDHSLLPIFTEKYPVVFENETLKEVIDKSKF